MRRSVLSMSFAVALFILAPAAAQSQGSAPAGKQAGKNLTKEQKIQMLEQAAKAHQAAADCLKAGKSESECREVMKKNAPMMGDMECPMMGDHHMMKGGGSSHSHD